jgi:hypothetical protein
MQSEEPHVSTEVDLSAHKKAEADFFDQTANVRTLFDNIPAEADIRRATRAIRQGCPPPAWPSARCMLWAWLVSVRVSAARSGS